MRNDKRTCPFLVCYVIAQAHDRAHQKAYASNESRNSLFGAVRLLGTKIVKKFCSSAIAFKPSLAFIPRRARLASSRYKANRETH